MSSTDSRNSSTHFFNDLSATPCWKENDVSDEDVQQFIGDERLHAFSRYYPTVGDDDMRQFIERMAGWGLAGHAGPSLDVDSKDFEYASWKEAPNSKCFASFGDQGTTATVGAFGQLLQFSTFLGAGSSGIFSVDHKGVEEPYQVIGRINNLNDRVLRPFQFYQADRSSFYGLRFPDLELESSAQPRLTWTHWRWPRYEYSRGMFQSHPQLKLTIQWMVHEKTVLQRCVLENNGEDDFQLDVEFCREMIIRDLDHLDPECEFNEDEYPHRHNWSGPKGYSWICMHELPGTRDRSASSKPYGISVACSVTINGKAQLFDNHTSPQTWPLPCDGRHPGETNRPSPPIEVITAYRTTLLESSETPWKTHIIPWEKMKVVRFVGEQNPAARSTPRGLPTAGQYMSPPVDIPSNLSSLQNSDAPKDHLAFISRRNLEHILSTCAIQVTPKDNQQISTLPKALKHVEAVALTCGDMFGHRICWSASFFAFRFLIAYYTTLQKPRKELRDQVLLDRIKRVCRGHLKWLHLVEPKKTKEQRFGANYWVTGEQMVKPAESLSWSAEASLLDTAFQILKAAAYMQLEDGDKIAAELMSRWAGSWLESLRDCDKRKKYAWPKGEEEGVSVFRLDEHVWIWRALKSLEQTSDESPERSQQAQLGLRTDGQVVSGGSPAPDWQEELERLREIYSPEVVRREISRRFTTENTVLRKRMLATTRSVRESRFMLHARDTALLYEEMFDFLGDSSIKELWKATIQAQMYHTEEQEPDREKALRYALYIMLGARELTIDNTPPDELVRTATNILIRSCSPNGFLPGRIEISTNRCFEASGLEEGDLESSYHASFEIPYILLTHTDRVTDIYKRPGDKLTPTVSRPQFPQVQFNVDRRQGDAERTQVLLHPSDLVLGGSTATGPDSHQAFLNIRRTGGKAVPFDKLVDTSNVVKLDDEWLYKYPDFFSRREILDVEKSTDTGLNALKNTLADDGGSPIPWDQWTIRKPQISIVDVPSSKRDGKKKGHKTTYHDTETPWGFKTALEQARSAELSKKRLLSFKMIPKQVALRCYAITEKSERPNLKDFFERHSGYEKLHIDNCNMIQNSWESEFHLSYYQLRPKPSTLQQGITADESKTFSKNSEKQIVRASASFRFHGDFFDRHWTGYMLDSTHNGPITDIKLLKHREYCQRKVLEQRFFADILKSVIESSQEILDEMKESLGFKSGSPSTQIHTTNAYLDWNTLWQEFEPLMQQLHADLASTQTVVDEWEAREEDRGKEKPRWTSSDERKYRASILIIRRVIKHQKRKLKDLQGNTKSFQDLCSDHLSKAREDLTFRSERNIAMFTYVTVVFLPLGFAASILSMNGLPDKSLAINMVIASAVALAVTIVALVNAKALASLFEKTKEFWKHTKDRKQSSENTHGRSELQNKDPASDTKDIDTPIEGSPSKLAKSWHLVLRNGRVFVQAPVDFIKSATRALRPEPQVRSETDRAPRNLDLVRRESV